MHRRGRHRAFAFMFHAGPPSDEFRMRVWSERAFSVRERRDGVEERRGVARRLRRRRENFVPFDRVRHVERKRRARTTRRDTRRDRFQRRRGVRARVDRPTVDRWARRPTPRVTSPRVTVDARPRARRASRVRRIANRPRAGARVRTAMTMSEKAIASCSPSNSSGSLRARSKRNAGTTREVREWSRGNVESSPESGAPGVFVIPSPGVFVIFVIPSPGRPDPRRSPPPRARGTRASSTEALARRGTRERVRRASNPRARRLDPPS